MRIERSGESNGYLNRLCAFWNAVSGTISCLLYCHLFSRIFSGQGKPGFGVKQRPPKALSYYIVSWSKSSAELRISKTEETSEFIQRFVKKKKKWSEMSPVCWYCPPSRFEAFHFSSLTENVRSHEPIIVANQPKLTLRAQFLRLRSRNGLLLRMAVKRKINGWSGPTWSYYRELAP